MVFRRLAIGAALLVLFAGLGACTRPAPLPCPEGDCAFAAPARMRGEASVATKAQVSWDEVPQASTYRVELSADPTFATGVRSITHRSNMPAGTALFTELRPGRTYHVRASVLDRRLRQASAWSAAAKVATKGAMHLSVGTYNIANPGDSWDERAPLIADGIVTQKLHVLGVQEVYRASERRSLLEHVNTKSMATVGGAVFRMTPDANSDLGYDNRVLYNSRVVDLLKSGATRYRHQVGDGEVDRWYAWATLRDRSSGWEILFVTTHLAPGNDDADRRQWAELIAGVNALRKAERIPFVVIAGDFNTTKFEKPADVMLPKMWANGYGDVLGQQFRSYDTSGARARVREDAWLNSFNGFNRDMDDYDVDDDANGNGVDWIFASNNLAVPYYRVYARYDDDDDELTKPIPSDHFLVWASLAYEPSLAQPRHRVA